jgi:hypothetical protein
MKSIKTVWWKNRTYKDKGKEYNVELAHLGGHRPTGARALIIHYGTKGAMHTFYYCLQ